MKKRILIFIDWYLPGYKAGGPIRSCANLVGHLKNEFDFYVVTSSRDYMTSEEYPGIEKNKWTNAPDGVRCWYHSGDSLSAGDMAAITREARPDYVYLNGMFSLPFTIRPLKYFRKRNVKTIVSVRGMLAPGALSVKPLKKRLFLGWAKISGLYDPAVFHAGSEEERNQVLKYFPKAIIRIAPNLPRAGFHESTPRKREGKKLRILSIARIAREKNLLFALKILKDVRSEVQFDIYGPVYDADYWKECRTAIGKLPDHVQVNYCGALPDPELERTLAAYDLFLMPTLGENFGHAILESLTAGMPVLISDRTPWKDIEKSGAGWALSLDNPDQFAEKIDRVASMTEEQYSSLSENAIRAARAFCNQPGLLDDTRRLFL